jgi:hypothetical protein
LQEVDPDPVVWAVAAAAGDKEPVVEKPVRLHAVEQAVHKLQEEQLLA